MRKAIPQMAVKLSKNRNIPLYPVNGNKKLVIGNFAAEGLRIWQVCLKLTKYHNKTFFIQILLHFRGNNS